MFSKGKWRVGRLIRVCFENKLWFCHLAVIILRIVEVVLFKWEDFYYKLLIIFSLNR